MKYATLALALLALAACKPKETLESQPLPPRAETPAAPAPSMPVLTAEGWGPIRMEMTHDQAVAALGGKVKADAQARDQDWLACHMIRPDAPEGVWIMVEEDRVTRVTVENGLVATDKGIVTGDPAAKVKAAYPSGLTETPHKYEDAPAAYLTFYARPGSAGIRYSINGQGEVASISGGTPSIEYVEGCA